MLPGTDVESQSMLEVKPNGIPASTTSVPQPQTNELSADHMIMISLSGALGIGLLIGTGQALSEGGPGSLLIGYILIGAIVLNVMNAICEMSTYIPITQGFSGYASRYVDPCLGFTVGWIYFLNYLIVTPHQITAGVMFIQYWVHRETFNPAITFTIFWAIVVIINYFGGMRLMKEIQYWTSAVKIAAITIMIIILTAISFGAGPDNEFKGFKYWKSPGAFKEYSKPNGYHLEGHLGRFVGFACVGITAVFSFLGIELIGITVGESSNPRKTIPKATKYTFWRAIGFYVVAAIVIGMCVPWNDRAVMDAHVTVGESGSPFLIAISNSGVQFLPDLFNALFTVFILAAALAAMYVGTKTLHSLSQQRHAPGWFNHVNDRGVPTRALIATSLGALTGLMNVSSSSTAVFEYFVSFAAILGLLTWISIFITHICFMKAVEAQGIGRENLPWKAPLQPFSSWFNLVMCCILALTKSFTVFLRLREEPFAYGTFIVGYVAIPLFVVMNLTKKYISRTVRVRPKYADLHTGLPETDAVELFEQPLEDAAQSTIGKIGRKLLKLLF